MVYLLERCPRLLGKITDRRPYGLLRRATAGFNLAHKDSGGCALTLCRAVRLPMSRDGAGIAHSNTDALSAIA